MFKDTRIDIKKIKEKLETKAIFVKKATKETKKILEELFGAQSYMYLRGIYPKKNELLIEVGNNFFASEIQINLNLIKQKLSYDFIKISIRVV